MRFTEAPAGAPHCSSNGDAAAALTALWGAQIGGAAAPTPPPAAAPSWRAPSGTGGLSANSSGFSAPQPVPQADAAAVAAALAAAAAANPLEAEGSSRPRPSYEGGNWRVKFLHKVGVAEQRGDGGPGGGLDASESIFDEAIPWSPAATQPPTSAAAASGSPASRAAADGRKEISRGGAVVPAGEDVVVVRRQTQARSSDDIRLGYIKKLEHSRAFIPQLSRPKTAQTVTIFDWDDTLLCTTHLEAMQRQQGALPAAVRDQLVALEAVVLSLLQQAAAVGKVFIITNASEGWVQHSSAMCFPNLQAQLAQVVIISARAGFEQLFPGDSHAWKMHAFLQVQNKLHVEAVTNLLSVGDSHIEMDAVVADKLTDIYQSGTTLNIWLERENAQPPPLPPPPLPPFDAPPPTTTA